MDNKSALFHIKINKINQKQHNMVKKSNTFQGRVYVVEDILDTKLINGIQHYKVKWKGYSFAECTWEPEQSFNCSRQILNQFLQARAEKQPLFEEKLQKISKQKDAKTKSKDKQQNCSTEKNSTRSLGQKYDKESECKKQQQREENLQEDNSDNVKYGYKFTTNSKIKSRQDEYQEQSLVKGESSPSIKEEHSEKIKIKKVKIQHQNESPSIFVHSELKKSPIQQSTRHHHSSDIKTIQQSVEKTTQQRWVLQKREDTIMQSSGIKLKVDPTFRIICVKLRNGQLQFTVMQQGEKRIKTKQEMHQRYSVQLCEYYEKFISFYQ